MASPRRIINSYGEEDPTNFSDDSLEESLPPPPPVTKRGSIAWEVPLGFDDEDPLLTPGSTKVIGRRRRRSTEHSSKWRALSSGERACLPPAFACDDAFVHSLVSGNSSIHRLKEVEDWPDPPPSDEPISPFSDSIYDSNDGDDYGLPSTLPLDLTFNGTYVIRKGRKKERGPVKNSSVDMMSAKPPPPVTYERQDKRSDLKRTSSTFDNIKLFLKDGLIEGINDAPPDFPPPNPPNLVRVVSLPTLPTEEPEPEIHHRNSKSERYSKLNELAVTLEEAEDELSSLDNPSLNSDERKTVGNQCNGVGEDKNLQTENSQGLNKKTKCNEVETQTDLSDMECQNELEIVGKQIREISKTKSELEEVEKKIQEIVKIKTVIERQAREEEELRDPWIKAAELDRSAEEKPPEEFRVNVEVLQHEFGPLPPSPVDEDDDEYLEIFHPSPAQTPRGKADTLPEPFYRCHDPPGSDPSGKYLNRPPPHRASDPINNSLKTRSMDAGFGRGARACCNGSRREVGARSGLNFFDEPAQRKQSPCRTVRFFFTHRFPSRAVPSDARFRRSSRAQYLADAHSKNVPRRRRRRACKRRVRCRKLPFSPAAATFPGLRTGERRTLCGRADFRTVLTGATGPARTLPIAARASASPAA